MAVGQMARIEKVFVTVFRQTVGGELSFTVQEPQGVTPSQYTYPEYAGVGVFVRVDGSAVTPPAVGDCLDVHGTVQEFQGRTQLKEATFTPATNCGTFPAAFEIPNPSVTFADVASDRDPVAADNQPGTKTEVYESVLVRVTNVRVISVVSGVRFEIAEQASPSRPEAVRAGRLSFAESGRRPTVCGGHWHSERRQRRVPAAAAERVRLFPVVSSAFQLRSPGATWISVIALERPLAFGIAVRRITCARQPASSPTFSVERVRRAPVTLPSRETTSSSSTMPRVRCPSVL